MPSDSGAMIATAFKTRADPDKMLSDYKSSNGDGLVTAYLAYECFRTRVNERLDLDGGTIEHLKILDWYFTTYLHHRKHKLPLSARQIAFLNAPIPVVDFARAVSAISFNFIRRELGQHWDLNDRRVVTEAIYWWCVERSPQMFIEGPLVPDYYISVLNEVDHHQRWLPFQLNYFAQRYYDVHSNLHFLRLDHKTDRMALLVYLVFRCGEEPHLARFLPRDAIGRLFAPLPADPDYILLDSIIAQLSASSLAAGLDLPEADGSGWRPVAAENAAANLRGARIIREALIDAIDKGGYSLRSGRRIRRSGQSTTEHFAQCYDARPLPDDKAEPGVALIGPLSATSGLGQASRMSLQVLQALTRNISLQNFDMDNPAPVGFSNESGAKFSKKTRSVNIIHLNAESIPLSFAYLDHAIYKDSYNIGYFFWELNRIPACHHLALTMLDEIWVSSEYNREIYSRYTDIPVINVGMAVEPVTDAAPLSRAYFGLPKDTFIFLSTFDSFSFVERKNPLGVIRAFREAFPLDRGDVALVLKTQNRFKVDDPHQIKIWAQISQYCNVDPRIVIINETFSYPELLAFKRQCDCYVSLHRSEGWGFGIIEAMQLGIPVIATAYSGNMEFCSELTSYLVEYDLVGPQPHEYIFVERDSQWAEPRTASAADCMRQVEEDRDMAKRIAAAAQLNVQTNFSIDAISRRYGARLKTIEGIIGADLFAEPPEPAGGQAVSEPEEAAPVAAAPPVQTRAAPRKPPAARKTRTK